MVGTLTFSGSYTSGGDACTLQGIGIQSSQIPEFVEITGQAGFIYQWVVGTDQTNGLVKILVATSTATNAPLSEHGATTIVSGVTGDTIIARMVFTIR